MLLVVFGIVNNKGFTDFFKDYSSVLRPSDIHVVSKGSYEESVLRIALMLLTLQWEIIDLSVCRLSHD